LGILSSLRGVGSSNEAKWFLKLVSMLSEALDESFVYLLCLRPDCWLAFEDMSSVSLALPEPEFSDDFVLLFSAFEPPFFLIFKINIIGKHVKPYGKSTGCVKESIFFTQSS
jgi:hypothetical protein